jgi:hypothetical protein
VNPDGVTTVDELEAGYFNDDAFPDHRVRAFAFFSFLVGAFTGAGRGTSIVQPIGVSGFRASHEMI